VPIVKEIICFGQK